MLPLDTSVGGTGSRLDLGNQEGCGSEVVASSDPPPPTLVGAQQFFRFCAMDRAERDGLVRRGIEVVYPDVVSQLDALHQLNPTRKQNILLELTRLSANPSLTLNDFLSSEENTPPARALLLFSYRVASITFLKGILLEFWRKEGFFGNTLISEILADVSLSMSRLLAKMNGDHNLVVDKYRWLLPTQDNYSWYVPSEDAVREAAPLLNKLSDLAVAGEPLLEWLEDIDSLLSTYEELTRPFSTVSGDAPQSYARWFWRHLLEQCHGTLVRKLGPKFSPKVIFNPIAGAGSLLVEPLLLWQDGIGLPPQSERETLLRNGISKGIFGCETDLFRRAFTEAKILCTATPLLLRSSEKGLRRAETPLACNIIPYEPLALAATENQTLSSSFSPFPLEGHLSQTACLVRDLCKGDYVVAHFPDHYSPVMSDSLKNLFPDWLELAKQGVPPLLWFYPFGLSKLREGGLLAFAGNDYWPASPEAAPVRKMILEQARVLQIIDCGTLSPPYPRYLFIMEKCSNPEKRATHKIQMIRAKAPLSMTEEAILAHLQSISEAAKMVKVPGETYSREDVETFFSAPSQGELGEEPWSRIDDSGCQYIIQMINRQRQTLGALFDLRRYEEHKNDPKTLSLWNRPSTPKEGILQLPLRARKWSCRYSRSGEENLSDVEWILFKKPHVKESLFYYYALFNSRILRFWIHQASTADGTNRIFGAKQISALPIRTIQWDEVRENPVQAEKIARIKNAIAQNDFDFLRASLSLEICCGREELVHDAIGLMVEEIFELSEKLARYRPFYADTGADQNLNEEIEPEGFSTVPIIASALMQVIPPERCTPLLKHREIYRDIPPSVDLQRFCLHQYRREAGLKCEGEHIALLSQQNQIIKLYGPSLLLDVIENALASFINHFFDEVISAIYLPHSVSDLEMVRDEIRQHCHNLSIKKRQLWWVIDRLFYRFYGFQPDQAPLSETDRSPTPADVNAIALMEGH
ncbi:MAG: hypothetical protein HY391_00325 [Deltaproteobacteria bacterium]|nr:hypothetical protein [Deltaproteobacteria bacterium]